jgi:single-strand DNA-binding protein
MQQLTIAGNVGKDAELRRTGNGDAVLGFSVAVDNGKDKNGNKRDSTWFDCSIWGKRAESLERYITKGTKVVLTGRPTAREHNGKAYLGISVNDLTFMGGNSQGERRQDSYQAPQQPAQQGFDDEIPF